MVYGPGLKYDSIYEQKNYLKEVEYLISCFSKYDKKVYNILDIGCGTGSHSDILLSKGYLQLGIDPCPVMIKTAKSKIPNGKFECTDLLNINDNSFDASISMFNVINHINSIQDLTAFFYNISLKLNHKGLLIFDCYNSIAFNKDNPKKIRKTDYTITPEFDKFTATLNLVSTSDIIELNYKINHRIWSVDILKELLNQYFSSISIFNHLSFTQASEDKYKIMFICQK